MTVRLVIARHGNTFAAGETPRRIGAKTDLPLSESGRAQAQKLGTWLAARNLQPDVVYTSRLKRTVETAQGALDAMGIKRLIHRSDLFDEIDYGPDENRLEPDVVARLGAQAYNAWEQNNVMPRDWSPQPETIRHNWRNFARHCETQHDEKTVLVVTSNGIARFAPLIANNADDVLGQSGRKMATGALGLFEGSGGLWMISDWNVKPAA